jgi:hypothetical protein
MSGLYKPGNAFTASFTVASSTGAATDADTLPTGVLYRNGAADTDVTVTITNQATGVYKLACTIPSGYSAGDVISVLISASVAGVAVKQFVAETRLVAFNPIDSAGLGLSGVNVNLNQALAAPADTDGSQSHTLGEALNAARAQGFGKWTMVGNQFTMYGPDGTTIWRAFTLDSGSSPSSRT